MTVMDLNLLPSRAKFQAVKIKLQNKVRLVMIIMVAVWAVAVAGVLIMTMVIKLRITTVNSQYKKAQADYLAMSENIITSQRLKYKAKIVGELLDKRFEYGKAFEAVNSLFPPGIQMTDFELENQKGFKLSGMTMGKENMDSIEKMVTKINQGENEKFAAAKLTALSYLNGSFTFSMEVTLK
jgi:Tfp pilus assembly protein PilN